MANINDVFNAMLDYYEGDTKRIQHFIKVHSIAKYMGEMENVDKNSLFIIEASALIHDIGIKNAIAKFNSSVGTLHEEEGEVEARKLLENLDISKDDLERIIYIVGHHHTFSAIDGIDFQILTEAILLVNYYEDNLPKDNILYSYDKVFKTNTGKHLAEKMYGINDD